MTNNRNFRISGQKIDTIKLIKYLGIYFDEGLTWKFQTEQIKSKLSRSCGLLAKLRDNIKPSSLLVINKIITEKCFLYQFLKVIESNIINQ